MRRTTALSSIWKAETAEGESLVFEQCKGGYFSTDDEWGLKFIGKSGQNNGTRQSDNLAVTDSLLFYNSLIDAEINTETLNTGITHTFECDVAENYSDYDSNYPEIEIYAGTAYLYSSSLIPGKKLSFTFTVDAETDTLLLYNFDNTEFSYTLTNISITREVSFPSFESPEPIQCVKAGTKIYCGGKNLFDISKVISSSQVENMGDYLYVTRYAGIATPPRTLKTYAPALAVGETYTISLRAKFDNGAAAVPYMHCGVLVNGKLTVEMTETLLNSGVSFYDFDTDEERGTTVYDIQIEKGTERTEYEPYNGNIITLPCDLYEGDIWYPMSGKVERYNVELKLESAYTGYSIYRWNNMTGICTKNNYISPSENRRFGYCTHEKLYSNGAAHNPIWIGANSHVVYWIGILDKLGITTVDEFKEWLELQEQNGTPVTIRYLPSESTPTIEWYEPQPLSMPTGSVNIYQVPAELTSTLQATALIRR